MKGLVWLTFSITDKQNIHTIGPACSSHISELQNHKNTRNFLVYSFPIFLHTCISYQWAAGSLPFSLWSSWLTTQRGLTSSRTEREDEIHLWHLNSSYPGQPQQHMEGSKPHLEAPKRLWVSSKKAQELAKGLPRNLWQKRECRLLYQHICIPQNGLITVLWSQSCKKCTAQGICCRTTYREHNSHSDKQGLGITSHLSIEGKVLKAKLMGNRSEDINS